MAKGIKTVSGRGRKIGFSPLQGSGAASVMGAAYNLGQRVRAGKGVPDANQISLQMTNGWRSGTARAMKAAQRTNGAGKKR